MKIKDKQRAKPGCRIKIGSETFVEFERLTTEKRRLKTELADLRASIASAVYRASEPA